MSSVTPVFHAGHAFALPPELSPLSARPLPSPNTGSSAIGADGSLTLGNAHVVWGTDGGEETATATITNNKNQIVGQVNVDHLNNTVSVTQFDSSTGKPDVDPATGKPVSSTFRYDADGNLINDGNLTSENLAHLPLGFDEYHNQLVTLQPGDGKTLPITVDIAPDSASLTKHELTAQVVMPAKPSSNPDATVDVLGIRGAHGVDQPGAKVDPKQLTALYSSDSVGGDVNFLSPTPPNADSFLHHLLPNIF